MKTRFEIEEEEAARCDARCAFFENPNTFSIIARLPNRKLYFEEIITDCMIPYANHGNCRALDVYRQTILELMETQCPGHS